MSTGSQTFRHLGPRWFSLVFVVYYDYVILLKVVPGPLPSCFKVMAGVSWVLLVEFVRSGWRAFEDRVNRIC